jgi:hypothetical protein
MAKLAFLIICALPQPRIKAVPGLPLSFAFLGHTSHADFVSDTSGPLKATIANPPLYDGQNDCNRG